LTVSSDVTVTIGAGGSGGTSGTIANGSVYPPNTISEKRPSSGLNGEQSSFGANIAYGGGGAQLATPPWMVLKIREAEILMVLQRLLSTQEAVDRMAIMVLGIILGEVEQAQGEMVHPEPAIMELMEEQVVQGFQTYW